jgi:hypothetical protein
MTDKKMLIIVPTRSRPENVAKVVEAWESTGAFDDGAELCFAHDQDDPKYPEYFEIFSTLDVPRRRAFSYLVPTWKPMVHKLDQAARTYAVRFEGRHFAIGFAGDDHLPRTRGWAGRYMAALAEMGTGIVSCPDGYRSDDLPTQWAMTADIVRALGRMVPAPVEHLYCDNAIRDLGKAAGCWRWLDDVLIEHMHPLSKTSGTAWDDQYRRVNREEQFMRDSAAYETWKLATPISNVWLERDAEKVRDLVAGHARSVTAPNPGGEPNA